MRDDHDFLRLHPATLLGSSLGRDTGPAKTDALPEPEPVRRDGVVRRVLAGFRERREAAARARAAGVEVVEDRCIKMEHCRYFGGLNVVGLSTGVIGSRRMDRFQR